MLECEILRNGGEKEGLADSVHFLGKYTNSGEQWQNCLFSGSRLLVGPTSCTSCNCLRNVIEIIVFITTYAKISLAKIKEKCVNSK